jgi:hypothetical protein
MCEGKSRLIFYFDLSVLGPNTFDQSTESTDATKVCLTYSTPSILLQRFSYRSLKRDKCLRRAAGSI